eukprot:3883331-Rhodomonas_salina.4
MSRAEDSRDLVAPQPTSVPDNAYSVRRTGGRRIPRRETPEPRSLRGWYKNTLASVPGIARRTKVGLCQYQNRTKLRRMCQYMAVPGIADRIGR